jgi:hypothetical protein
MCDIASMPKDGEVNNDEQMTEHKSWLWATISNIKSPCMKSALHKKK